MTTRRIKVDQSRKVQYTRCERWYVATVQLNSREGLFQVICPQCEEWDLEHKAEESRICPGLVKDQKVDRLVNCPTGQVGQLCFEQAVVSRSCRLGLPRSFWLSGRIPPDR